MATERDDTNLRLQTTATQHLRPQCALRGCLPPDDLADFLLIRMA